MIKLIILEKYSASSPHWGNLEKKIKILGLSVEQVVRKYQGFEGDLVDMVTIKKDESEEMKILEICSQLSASSNYLMLFVGAKMDLIPQFIENAAVFVGCEIGVCEKDSTLYSSIFNEILFGSISELNLFQKELNENFLFPDVASAQKYVVLHDQLSAQGKDVEDYETINVYNIWRYVSSLS